MNLEPMVTIITCTYNHEMFIAECLDGVHQQKTNFNFLHIIGDDASVDDTVKVIEEYKKVNGANIKLVDRVKNVGATENTIHLFSLIKTKYVALCDGDDYWNDKNKLQKQVDFLESNNSFGSSYHRSCVVDSAGTLLKADKRLGYKDHKGEDLIKGKGEMLTNTIMFRNQITLPDNFYSVPNGDTYLWHLLGFIGDCKFHKDIEPAAYRLHAAGVWSGANEKNKIISLCITYGMIYDNLILKHCDTSYLIQLVQKNVNKYLLNKLNKKKFGDYFYFLNYSRKIKFLKTYSFLLNHISFTLNAIINRIKVN